MACLQENLRVVLVAPRNPLNIGAAARAMSNFGFLHLRVVNAYEVAYTEARSAVNAAAVLAQSQQYATVAEATADCTLVVGTASRGHRTPEHAIRRLEQGGSLICNELLRGQVALLFGSEKFGLSNEDMAHCHWLMRIPTRAAHESMNLGQAVAVCLYELIRDEQQEARESHAPAPASAGDTQRLADLLTEALGLSGYVNERTEHSSEMKIRRLVYRMGLRASDAIVWQGMLRQILWRLRQSG